MKRKQTKKHLVAEEINTDFYKASPSEKPLVGQPADESQAKHSAQSTLRHQHAGRFRKKENDIRDKKALEAILRFVALGLLLLIILVMLMKGIGLYEKRMVLNNENKIKAKKGSSDNDLALVNTFNLSKEIDLEKFTQRVKDWEKVEQIMRSANALSDQNIYDKAIEEYQTVLTIIPSHMKALERLGDLYTQQKEKDYTKAINIYQHLLNIAPGQVEVQKKLIEALSHTKNTAATIFMSTHYLKTHLYDSDIQRFLANSYYANGDYAQAIKAYKRILLNDTENKEVLESISISYIQLNKFSLALYYLKQLIENFSSNEAYYLQISLCHAQLKDGKKTVQTLSRAAQIFDRTLVVGWVKDPLFDPVRNDRNFTMFIDRIAGIETRKQMESLVAKPDRKSQFSSAFSLTPNKGINKDLLKTTR